MIKDFFNSSLGLLLIGFILTTICGTIINNFYARTTWEREKKFELLKRSLDRNDKLVEDISIKMGTRAIKLLRVFWVLETPQAPSQSPEERNQFIKQIWEEYVKSAIDWNENLRVFMSKVYYLAGPETARLFYLSEEDATEAEREATVDQHFQRAHHAVRQLKDIILKHDSENWQKAHKTAEQSIHQLYKKIDVFLVTLYKSLDFHARTENPLK